MSSLILPQLLVSSAPSETRYDALLEPTANPEEKVPDILATYAIGTSWQNRSIDAFKISDNPHINESEPAVLFVAGHHGNEVISVEMAQHLIEFLVSSYETRADIRQLINEREIWIIPCLNPDGYECTLNGDPWRKNMRDNGDGTFGVDLNRNYGYNWGTDTHTSANPGSDTYHGPEPFSEPETQAVKELVETINFTASISFHSSGELILYPWGYTSKQTDRHELQEKIASDMAAMNGYKVQQASEQYYESRTRRSRYSSTERISASTLATKARERMFNSQNTLKGCSRKLRPGIELNTNDGSNH